MKRDDTVYLLHILESIGRIERYLEGVNEETFRKETLIQDGIIRQIEIIGEAAKRLSSKLRADYSQIPWQDIIGMRDKLAHDYFGVDLDQVWLTAQEDVPSLKEELNKMLC